MRGRAVVGVLLALTWLVAGCGSRSPKTEGTMPSMSEEDVDAGSGHGGMGHDEPSPVADGARRIEVAATSFEFDPSKITVAAGEEVAIVLTSDDLLHDVAVDGLDVHVAAEKGETEEGGLRADEPGEYVFYCTVDGHREAGMEGELIVEPDMTPTRTRPEMEVPMTTDTTHDRPRRQHP